jgi:hypothetical protein
MTYRPSPSGVVVALGIVLLVTPAFFPVQQLLFHETRAGTVGNESQLERDGYEIVAYENLSERGKTVYVRALENGGQYAVPVGEGAPEFDYSGEDPGARTRPGSVVIERPPDAADLPDADEPVEAVDRARERARERAERNPDADVTTPDFEERRREIARYDLIETRLDSPPLTASANLVRLLSALGGVLCIGVGGYRAARP